MSDVVPSILVLAVFVVAVSVIDELVHERVVRDSLKDNPPSRWKKALIDAEAERAKEAIK